MSIDSGIRLFSGVFFVATAPPALRIYGALNRLAQVDSRQKINQTGNGVFSQQKAGMATGG
jgi:hypothetical protein